MTEIPFGFVKDGKIYRKGWSNNPDKMIGEVRDDDIEKSSKFFLERFSDLAGKVEDVTTKIDETNNKGSFLMKLIHLKEQLPQHDGLGDYPALLEVIEKYESLVKDIIQKNRQRNTEIKEALILEADKLEDIINWKEATEEVHDLKSRWIKTGSAEEEKNTELEDLFWGKITHFFDRKKQFHEDKQRLAEHYERKYQELVKEAEMLTGLHGKDRFDKVKALKEEWKDNGGIPSEQYQPLHDAFQKALKGGKKKFLPKTINYTEILEKLHGIKTGKLPLDKKELDGIKKAMFKDRSRSNEKNEILQLISLLMENDFILMLANKRFPDFPKMDKEKKLGIKKGILKDLIQRDTDDLKIYEENSANFSSSDGSMNKLVEGKIKSQKKKIATKTLLLEQLMKGEF